MLPVQASDLGTLFAMNLAFLNSQREPLRIFYESLSKQIPSSDMAEFWYLPTPPLLHQLLTCYYTSACLLVHKLS